MEVRKPTLPYLRQVGEPRYWNRAVLVEECFRWILRDWRDPMLKQSMDP